MKNSNFLTLFGQKIPNFEFSYGYHYSHTLENIKDKTLGSFQPKLMTKIKIISQKLSKNWIFGKNGPVTDRQTDRQTNRRTDGRTDNSESLGLNRLCRETKNFEQQNREGIFML